MNDEGLTKAKRTFAFPLYIYLLSLVLKWCVFCRSVRPAIIKTYERREKKKKEILHNIIGYRNMVEHVKCGG